MTVMKCDPDRWLKQKISQMNDLIVAQALRVRVASEECATSSCPTQSQDAFHSINIFTDMSLALENLETETSQKYLLNKTCSTFGLLRMIVQYKHLPKPITLDSPVLRLENCENQYCPSHQETFPRIKYLLDDQEPSE